MFITRPDSPTEGQIARLILKPAVRFAFLPVRHHSGRLIWLQKYKLAPIGAYVYRRPYEDDKLVLYRVGGSCMDDDGCEWFPRRAFEMGEVHINVDDFDGDYLELLDFLNTKAALP